MMTEQELAVYHLLEQMHIEYERVEHPAVHTCEEADAFIEHLEGIRSKTLFLTNKKRTGYYLVVMEGDKPLDIKAFSELVGDRHLSFASEERLEEQLCTSPGMVSIFALINNKAHNVMVVIDAELKSREQITFHPNVNTVTIQISMTDMDRFLEGMGNPVQYLSLP